MAGKIVALYEEEPWETWEEAKKTSYATDFMKWYDKDAKPDGKLDRAELKTFIVTQVSPDSVLYGIPKPGTARVLGNTAILLSHPSWSPR